MKTLKEKMIGILVLIIALSLVCSVAAAEEPAKEFVPIATLDLNDEGCLTHEKDAGKQTKVGVMTYFDYNGDLLSIVEDENAQCGKAIQVASSSDFPRTQFEVESGVIYQFSYKIRMTDASKFVESLGISPYINFSAKDADGNSAYDRGFDFHRNYADVVYAYTEDYIETKIWFTTTEKNGKMTVNLYDSFENVLAENERDSYKFPEGYTFLDTFSVAFYTQGFSKDMPYTISDICLSAYMEAPAEKEAAAVFTLNKDEAIVADASQTDSASNPGKLVVNWKSDFLSVVEDADAQAGFAVQVKNATDYPRIRFNTLETGKAYKVSYRIRMTDETLWPAEGGSLGITPYLDFTAYSPAEQNWNTGKGGYDFHCGYKDVQYAFNGGYKDQYFCFSTELTDDGLVLKLFADDEAFAAGNAADGCTFPAGYTQLAAVDMAFYKQGAVAEMPYRIADLTVTALN